jgi:hypothetical protein
MALKVVFFGWRSASELWRAKTACIRRHCNARRTLLKPLLLYRRPKPRIEPNLRCDCPVHGRRLHAGATGAARDARRGAEDLFHAGRGRHERVVVTGKGTDDGEDRAVDLCVVSRSRLGRRGAPSSRAAARDAVPSATETSEWTPRTAQVRRRQALWSAPCWTAPRGLVASWQLPYALAGRRQPRRTSARTSRARTSSPSSAPERPRCRALGHAPPGLHGGPAGAPHRTSCRDRAARCRRNRGPTPG